MLASSMVILASTADPVLAAGRVTHSSHTTRMVTPLYTGPCGTVTYLMGTPARVGVQDRGSVTVQSSGGPILGGNWNITWGDGSSSSGSVPSSFGTSSWNVYHTWSAAGWYDTTLTGNVDTLFQGWCGIIPITDQVEVNA